MEINIDLNGENSYSIYIDKLKEISFDRKALIVTNTKVSGLHLKYLIDRVESKELYIYTLQDGEEYKNLKSIENILEAAFNHRLDRKSLFIAFGGGVVGDMVGFAAGIFLRGVDFIQIPTTLLAQVDSSVGGKTGVNSRFGKNLIGVFNQPKAVYIDTYFLKTLPSREFGAGVAEIIKMAVMFDRAFFEWLEINRLDTKGEQNLKEAIRRSVEIKADVVSKDEKEAGVRSVLNYGHTFAHVIESITKYSRFLHGEAVAIGICMANDLALKLELIDKEKLQRVKNILKSYNLPTHFKVESKESFYDLFFLDKKSEDSKIKFILPDGIGDFKIVNDVSKDIVLEVLEGYVG